jgi:hypothetical protein
VASFDRKISQQDKEEFSGCHRFKSALDVGKILGDTFIEQVKELKMKKVDTMQPESHAT